MKKYIMALDAGTTSNRCILFNEQGVDELWEKITQTQGTGIDSLFASMNLVSIVTEVTYGKVYLDASNNIISNVSLATH